ncbi:NAD(P)H-dependent glycerol-3-phosphate dehydrogenase [Acetobacter tropicalis]|uniref:Glycerol-3-phosphate dehydrogenase [NAD(P)+] n=1 Tax=Acetobacter tropicalis TaxID=104102 RepID=A0A252ABT3_9PROT|nr:NAD(P)H-dependent glycerol-3-phosphate dehydrogenase [Acetobacter tropicalis]OUI87058.1 glycerol-3-phosphate dehydrogenase [Acetobacter tropicalis]
MNRHILVMGAGAWGSALALHMHRTGARVQAWARNPASRLPSGAMPRLPDWPLPADVTVSDTIPAKPDLILVVVPVQHLASVLPLLPQGVPAILCCKGVERASQTFPLDVLARVRPECPGAVLSGPNFAHEIAAGLPAAAVVAAPRMEQALTWAAAVSSPTFRLYASDDCTGVQLGGAAKNVIAIAAGTAMGAGLGENARAALITRGLAETGRLAAALGGQPATLAGLAGMGDLVLTCTGAASRNYQMGLALGRGAGAEDAAAALPGVAEGVTTASALLGLARAHGVAVPIIETVSDFLAKTLTLEEARSRLLDRPLKAE